jgi:hypothetical protein
MHQTDYVFALTVLDNAAKHRKVKRAHPLVKRVEKILIDAGFVEQADEYLILPSSEISVKSTVREWVQQKADESLDPESISFSQFADLLKINGTLPGIRNDIDDSPLGNKLSVGECCGPPKPWETTI